MAQQTKHTFLAIVKTSIQILRTHVRPNMVVHICNSCVFLARWERETVSDACKPASLVVVFHLYFNK